MYKIIPWTIVILMYTTELNFQEFLYANWDACPDSRCSVTILCISIEKCLISWKSKKQRADATTQICWMHQFLDDLGVQCTGPANHFGDF